jgi:hypothetical protein
MALQPAIVSIYGPRLAHIAVTDHSRHAPNKAARAVSAQLMMDMRKVVSVRMLHLKKTAQSGLAVTVYTRPGFAYGHHVGFVVDKAALGQVFSEYFGYPCQSFHRFLHYHNHPGLTQ